MVALLYATPQHLAHRGVTGSGSNYLFAFKVPITKICFAAIGITYWQNKTKHGGSAAMPTLVEPTLIGDGKRKPNSWCPACDLSVLQECLQRHHVAFTIV